jgi:hypothetical protein
MQWFEGEGSRVDILRHARLRQEYLLLTHRDFEIQKAQIVVTETTSLRKRLWPWRVSEPPTRVDDVARYRLRIL